MQDLVILPKRYHTCGLFLYPLAKGISDIFRITGGKKFKANTDSLIDPAYHVITASFSLAFDDAVAGLKLDLDILYLPHILHVANIGSKGICQSRYSCTDQIMTYLTAVGMACDNDSVLSSEIFNLNHTVFPPYH